MRPCETNTLRTKLRNFTETTQLSVSTEQHILYDMYIVHQMTLETYPKIEKPN